MGLLTKALDMMFNPQKHEENPGRALTDAGGANQDQLAGQGMVSQKLVPGDQGPPGPAGLPASMGLNGGKFLG